MSQFNFTAEDLIDKEAIARLVKAKTEESITGSIIYQVSDMVKTHAVAALDESIKEIVEAQKAQILAGAYLENTNDTNAAKKLAAYVRKHPMCLSFVTPAQYGFIMQAQTQAA